MSRRKERIRTFLVVSDSYEIADDILTEIQHAVPDVLCMKVGIDEQTFSDRVHFSSPRTGSITDFTKVWDMIAVFIHVPNPLPPSMQAFLDQSNYQFVQEAINAMPMILDRKKTLAYYFATEKIWLSLNGITTVLRDRYRQCNVIVTPESAPKL